MHWIPLQIFFMGMLQLAKGKTHTLSGELKIPIRITYVCILHTANIFNIIFTLFTSVPFPTVIPLYGLHLITAPSTVEKCKH